MNLQKIANRIVEKHYPNKPNAIIDEAYREVRMKALKQQVEEELKNCFIHDVSCSSVNKEHLDDLILKWQYIVKGNPKDNLQVIAIENCINDLKIIITAYCS